LDSIENQEAGNGEGEHRQRIDKPVLLVRWINACQAVKAALDRSDDRAEKVSLACVNVRNEFAERHGAAQHQSEYKRDLRPTNERHRITFLI
jgi:hypothetical protein